MPSIPEETFFFVIYDFSSVVLTAVALAPIEAATGAIRALGISVFKAGGAGKEFVIERAVKVASETLANRVFNPGDKANQTT